MKNRQPLLDYLQSLDSWAADQLAAHIRDCPEDQLMELAEFLRNQCDEIIERGEHL